MLHPAIASKVTSLPTIFARLVICTVSSNMALLEAVVAQPQVTRWHWGSGAVSGAVARLAASVADALIRTTPGL